MDLRPTRGRLIVWLSTVPLISVLTLLAMSSVSRPWMIVTAAVLFAILCGYELICLRVKRKGPPE